MSLVSPYQDTFQYTRIKLEPHNFNSDLESNLLHALRQKESKKCNKNGFIDEIYKIEKYNGGFISPDNLSGSAMFDVKYNCRICYPIIRSTLVVQVKTINQELIVCTNGPIFIFIPKDEIDSTFWDFSENFKNKKTDVELKENDFVKVEIIDRRINQGGYIINTIGKLLDNASKREITKFYGVIEEVIEEDQNFI
tara:strand:- start:4663 stop:5247 length:585 start_codon:yes stop_codon:yes gene_type:complete